MVFAKDSDTRVITQRPEEQYLFEVSYKHRKKLGQFFTPLQIANFMIEWVVNNRQKIRLLDPAIGFGIFFRSIIDNYPTLSKGFTFTGYDIDPIIIQKTEDFFSKVTGQKINLNQENYLTAEWETGYDGIVCNPPYLKFHDYTEKDTLLSIFKEKGMNLSGLTNIYSLFLLKSIHQLKPDGRMAYIIPSDFFNADYGKKVKEYLQKSGLLRFIIVIDNETGVFEDVLTTSSILLLANDGNSEGVEFFYLRQMQDLKELSSYLQNYPTANKSGKFILTEKLEAGRKWRMYYQRPNRDKYINLVPFQNYARVSRGIATGANDYFSFSISKREKYQIPEEFLLPCLMKAKDARKHFFTQTDFEELKKADKCVYLLNALNFSENKYVCKYLKLGEELEINRRYLTGHRKPWYMLEDRPPAPILVTVFNRSGLRFVKNEAAVYNLTAFHCVYVKKEIMPKIDILMAYLITTVAQEIFADSRREYGGGLKKYEPNDLNNGYVVDLNMIPGHLEEEILQLYYHLKNLELDGQETDIVKERLSELFLQVLRK